MANHFIELFSLKKVRDWYARFERPISSLSLIGGFIFNAIALTRVDEFWENFWIIVHILLVATCNPLHRVQIQQSCTSGL
jgi:hypothetical protein